MTVVGGIGRGGGKASTVMSKSNLINTVVEMGKDSAWDERGC